MTPVQLPEVPAPSAWIDRFQLADIIAAPHPVRGTNFRTTLRLNAADGDDAGLYTAAQLREYATEAVMADRRLIGARVADLSAWLRSGNGVPADLPFVFRERWQKIVADIRALETLITPSETNSER